MERTGIEVIKVKKKNTFWEIRTAASGRNNNVFSRLIARYKHKKLMEKFCASIPLSVQIDGEPNFPHGLAGIFVSSNAKIGKNCTIFHQVTIGSNTLKESKRQGAPVIGDNVYIGCGAKIIGGITIGNNVRIGANCVVVCDIPDNSTVVLESPRVIVHDEARDNSYVPIKKFDK